MGAEHSSDYAPMAPVSLMFPEADPRTLAELIGFSFGLLARVFVELFWAEFAEKIMAGQGRVRELLGPLHPYKSDDEEEDCAQEEEGEQDSEFVDAEELCSGGIKAGSLPGRMRGE